MTALTVLALLAWGTLVAVDLASAPQGLLSRPIVAATVTGLIVGEVSTALLAGAVLELYELDVMPVGAARYPDLGAAAVPAAVAAIHAPVGMEVGLAGLLGLPLAIAGGWGLHQVHRRNAIAMESRRARVAAGDARAIWELQRDGLLRDALRGLLLVALGLFGVAVLNRVDWSWTPHGAWLSVVVLAGGLAAALAGAMRRAGPGAARRWFAVGAMAGLVVVLWR